MARTWIFFGYESVKHNIETDTQHCWASKTSIIRPQTKGKLLGSLICLAQY